ncbi:septum site-determining protein MinD [Halomicrobium zhouii]|uniref:Septum site-determining protein MinD n=1 Tax=Halomicrobium zhouii TaxID=767519 RepID=A0A1I6LVL4_9EURY|nr:P-loop NTPase [Halomicrobium zhouii]SFS07511.1 septum site-determining protein MinD [Halomicrobium zhouii]
MIAVAGGKGGCGKTTTTACLARALADAGSDPVVVDADVGMPDLHVVAGARLDAGLATLASGAPVSKAVQSTLELPGVRLVANGPEQSDDLATALDRLQTLADPVLVDTAAGASPAVATPLRAADATIVVSTPTPQSLEDAAKTAAMARALDAPVVGSVVTRSDGSVDPGRLLDCPTLGHVPSVPDPLADDRVRAAYADVCESLPKRNI